VAGDDRTIGRLAAPSIHDALPHFLTRKGAGAFLQLSPRTLEKYRVVGGRPTYRKLGGRVVYAVADLVAWADLGRRHTTSDKQRR